MSFAPLSLLPTFCQVATAMSSSWRGQFWFVISLLGWKGWLLIIVGLLVWAVIDFISGGSSANGFSPEFNIAVGSLTFYFFQTLIALILAAIFGDGVYCLVWPLVFHIIPFWLTGAFWRWTGFWPH